MVAIPPPSTQIRATNKSPEATHGPLQVEKERCDPDTSPERQSVNGCSRDLRLSRPRACPLSNLLSCALARQSQGFAGAVCTHESGLEEHNVDRHRKAADRMSPTQLWASDSGASPGCATGDKPGKHGIPQSGPPPTPERERERENNAGAIETSRVGMNLCAFNFSGKAGATTSSHAKEGACDITHRSSPGTRGGSHQVAKQPK